MISFQFSIKSKVRRNIKRIKRHKFFHCDIFLYMHLPIRIHAEYRVNVCTSSRENPHVLSF